MRGHFFSNLSHDSNGFKPTSDWAMGFFNMFLFNYNAQICKGENIFQWNLNKFN